MTSLRDKLSTAVNSAEADSLLFHNIVHGNETTVVSTEGGQVPSVAKAIKDICATITSESNNIVEIAQTAAQTASEKAIICKESEKVILENVKSSQNAKIWAEGTDKEVAECGGTHSARGWVELARKTTIGSYPTEVSGTATANQKVLSLNGAVLGVSSQILSVVVENTILLPQNYDLSADGRSIELLSPLTAGERWSIKYLQDIQTLSTLVGAIVYEEMTEIQNE